MLSLLTLASAGVTYATFGDKGKLTGSKFSVGSSDLKILAAYDAPITPDNLVDEKPGPEFNNIVPNWQDEYKLKLYNNGTTGVKVTSNAYYETVNDPDDLRTYIFVEPIVWDDMNNNAIVDAGEEGASLGKKSIVKWKTEGYDLGNLESGQVKSLILKFSVDSLSDTKQGKTGIFDFVFDSESI